MMLLNFDWTHHEGEKKNRAQKKYKKRNFQNIQTTFPCLSIENNFRNHL